MSWRDIRCGELRPEHVGQRLTVAGWVDTRRDHGGLVFVDLRDQTGVCQLVVNPETAPEAARAAHEVRNEFVLRATGEIVAWLMNGASLSSGARLLPPGTWTVVTTGDYNGDGKADLVFKNTATNEVVMWLMNGTLPTAGFTLTTDPQYSVTP